MKDKNKNFHYPENPKQIKFPIYARQLSGRSLFPAFTHFISAKKTRLAEKLEKRYGKGIELTSSGSAALVLALKLSGAEPGKEVIFSSFSCPNVIDAVLQSGASPVFANLDDDLSLSFEDVKNKVTERTCAVILTHVYGRKENMNLIEWAKEKRIRVIDDAAQAMFTKQAGTFAGGLGDFGILSFGMSKPLSSIGGGALIARKDVLDKISRLPMEQRKQVDADYDAYKRQQRMQALMSSKALSFLFRKAGVRTSLKTSKLEVLPKKPATVPLLRMHPVRQAIIEYQLSKMERLVKDSSRNLETARYIFAEAEELYGIKMIQPQAGESLNYLTIVFPHEGERYDCSVYLAAKGIQTCWNYLPLHLIPLYQPYSQLEDENSLWKRVLSLPFKPPLGTEQVKYIAETVLTYAKQKNKK
ncbi:aminotransferase class V-fold PLP-dependent enzyme [Bacillus halotolerans]|uniref:Aminotransferase class V-fold PLP-dependent enzyme n=1 Tax=Bacillus halotolerans TaxID=260554 RepID=A0A9Q4EJF5_9BACI|nr:aminotransferase class V-fold PLP-dependent enzyme [Bacillus halotolerans]MCY9185417.1 aminotransferase class V-fold PLP-dependent enzyme [Bacillus halotolerans]MCY9200692.1 aminotransferase class V-fold PLP-dependent enzyme [Bacillus halotolerans]